MFARVISLRAALFVRVAKYIMSLPSGWNPLISNSANLCFPEAYFDRATAFCRTNRDDFDNKRKIKDSPFRRYVDLWMLSLIVGRSSRQFFPSTPLKKFIDGKIFQNDISRISIILSIVYLHEGKNASGIQSANFALSIANAYVAGGVPLVLESMVRVAASSIENLFQSLKENKMVSDDLL